MMGSNNSSFYQSKSPKATGEFAPPHSLTLSEHRILIVIALIGLALRIVYLWGQSRNNPLFLLPKVDAYWHHEWAQQIASGAGMSPEPYYRAPLYYYLLGALYAWVGPSVLWGRLLGCLFGSLTTYLISRLGVQIGGFRLGALAGLFAAFYWPAIYFDAELLTVSLECMLAVALLVTLIRTQAEPKPLLYLTTGLIWGLASITRPNFLALAPLVFIWIFVSGKPGLSTARKCLHLGLVTVGLLLAVLPVTARNLRFGGEPILITYSSGVNLFIGNNPDSGGISPVVPGTRRSLEGGYKDARRIPQAELGRALSSQEISDYWSGRALQWITDHPLDWAKHTIYKARLFFSPVELPNNQPIWFFASLSEISAIFWLGFPPIASLALASCVFLFPRWRKWYLLWGYFLIYMASIVIFFVNARYRLPVYPILILAAAAGLIEIARQIKKRNVKGIAGYLSVLLFASLFISTNPPFEREAFAAGGEGEGYGILGKHYAALEPNPPHAQEKALRHFKQAVQLKPSSPNLRLSLAAQYVKTKRLSEAQNTYQGALRSFPEVAEVHFQYGRFLSKQGRTPEAIEEMRAAARLQPAFAEVHQALGCQLGSTGHTHDAIKHLVTSLSLSPQLLEAKLCLAQLHRGEKRYSISENLYQQVLQIEEVNIRALVGLGDLELLKDKPNQAIPFYRSALAQNKALPFVSQNLANALEKIDEHELALQALEAGVSQNPDDFRLNVQLARLLATSPNPRLRNGPRALKIAKKVAASQARPSLDALETLSAAYAELGKWSEAIRTAEVALELARNQGAIPNAIRLKERLKHYRARLGQG